MRPRPLAVVLAAAAVVALPALAAAQGGPLGIGTPEPGAGAATWAGPLAPIFAQIAAWQAEFSRTLTDALSSMKEDGSVFWLLAGVSFLYGIFHAAGPGHGKAVIGAYLLASGETLKRGIVISFAAAFAQALVAVALVRALAGIFNVTAMEMTQATNALEIASYALIALVGAWLLWTRLRPSHGHSHGPTPALAGIGPADDGRGHNHDHADHAFLRHDHDHASHDRDPGHDHSHAPDPRLLRGPLTFASAWTAIFAVGIRPCSGAIIVLVSALSQGLYAAGVASTFVMAVGTAITVSALASLAVLARDAALRLSGGGNRLTIVLRAIEIAAAAAVLLFGLLLLGGALSA